MKLPDALTVTVEGEYSENAATGNEKPFERPLKVLKKAFKGLEKAFGSSLGSPVNVLQRPLTCS